MCCGSELGTDSAPCSCLGFLNFKVKVNSVLQTSTVEMWAVGIAQWYGACPARPSGPVFTFSYCGSHPLGYDCSGVQSPFSGVA